MQPRFLSVAVFLLSIFALGKNISAAAVNQALQDQDGTSAPVAHERFAPFFADDGFKSELLVQNLRLDVGVTITPALIVAGREINLDPVSIAPHSSATVDINATLLSHGLKEKRGVVAVRYAFKTYGAVTAVVESTNRAHHLYLDFVAQSPEEFWYGTSLDAVIWAPEEGTEGFVSIINTATETRKAKASFIVNGHTEGIQEIDIAPHQLHVLRIDALVNRSLESGAGVHLTFTGNPGDIVAEGTLLRKKTGFTKHIRFMDTALKFSNSSLRTNFLFLGRQPESDGFPSQVSFRSVAVVRNIDSVPVQISPLIKFLQSGTVQKLNLAPFQIEAGESRLIDFSQELKTGKLPVDFTQGSLQLITNTKHTSVVSELFNFDEHTLAYVIGSSFSAHPARATNSIWRIDGTFQTTIAVENTAEQQDHVNLTLFSDSGTYEKSFPIPAGALIKINLKDLQLNGIRDKDGHLLLATSGTLALAGTNGTKSALAFDKLIHSADESEYVGLLANPCNFVTNIAGSLTGDISPYSPLVQLDWSDGSTTFDTSPGLSSDNSLITIDATGVTINSNPNGVEQSASLFFFETTTTCDICSSDTLTAVSTITIPACPSTVTINKIIPLPLDPSSGFLTGVGVVAAMLVGPPGTDFKNAEIQETITQTSNTCPAVFGPVCGSPGVFKIGAGGNDPFPPLTNIFYDKHAYKQSDNKLVAAGINSCAAVCAQTYTCGGGTTPKAIGKFTITKKFSKGTINGIPVTLVDVTKQPAN